MLYPSRQAISWKTCSRNNAKLSAISVGTLARNTTESEPPKLCCCQSSLSPGRWSIGCTKLIVLFPLMIVLQKGSCFLPVDLSYQHFEACFNIFYQTFAVRLLSRSKTPDAANDELSNSCRQKLVVGTINALDQDSNKNKKRLAAMAKTLPSIP